MKPRAILFVLLILLGCSSGGTRSGGTAAPAAGPQAPAQLKIDLELPQNRGVNEVATVSVEVSDPNPPFNLVNGPVVTPVPEGATRVQTTLQVIPGLFRLSVFGYNEQGELVAQSSPLTLDLVPGSIEIRTIDLVRVTPPTPPVPPDVPVATSLQFSVQPPLNVDPLTPFTVSVAVLDQSGALLTTATDPITVQLGSNPGGATLGGTLTVTPTEGFATFNTLTLDLAGSGYTLIATSSSLASATSDPLDVNAAPPPTLTSISLAPNPITLMTGATQPLTATGTFSDASTQDITSQVTFSSVNPAVASVDSAGVVTAQTPGTAQIDATLNGVTGSVLVTVSPTPGQLPNGNRAFSTPNIADWLIALDVNGDGRDDALITSQAPGPLGLFQLLAQPDGTLGTATLIDTEAAAPARLIKGDLDGANGMDFIMLKGDGVKIFLSNGAGGFTTQDIPAGSQIWGDVGDIDGDGDLDLVTNEGITNLETYFNNGSGTFVFGAAVAAGGQAVTVNDFNGDGRADVGLAFGTDVRVYLAGVGGVFAGFTAFPMPPGANALDLTSANLDGANGFDLVATDVNNSSIVMYLNNGVANFGTGVPISTSTNFGVFRVRCADIDGDGDQDVGFTNIVQDSLNILRNSGVATFTQEAAIGLTGSSSELDFGNVDGINGQDCILSAVSTTSPGVSVCLNQGGGYFTNPTLTANLGINSSALGNFDNLNGPDLVVANTGAGQIQVYNDLGGRTYSAPTGLGTGTNPVSVATGDFDGDGLDDIISSNNGSVNISLFLNNGAGFNPAVPVSYNLPIGADSGSLVVADFDGANGPDIAVIQTGQVRILLNSGAATFATQVIITQGGVDPSSGLAAGDLDGDGDVDLVVARTTANLLGVLLNNGTGITYAQSSVALSGGLNPQSVALGDFDGVNGPDLACLNNVSVDVSVIPSTGAGTFGAATNFPALSLANLAAADFDGDGILDLVTGSEGLVILPGTGGGAFGSPILYGAFHGTAEMFTLGDLDLDGHQDVVFPYAGTGGQPSVVQLFYGQ